MVTNRKVALKRKLLIGAVAATLPIWAGVASANFCFDLGTGNSAISGFPGPYDHVCVDLTSSTTATIEFTSLTNSGNIYLMGDGGTVGFNVNASSWMLGTITGTNSGTGFTPGPFSDGGAGNEDGFGSFNQTINSFDGFKHSSDDIIVALTNAGGTWADAASVLTGNADGFLAATHVFVTSFPANGSNGALATGFATGNGTSQETPEPGSVALLAVGFLGIALTRNRRKRER